MGFISKFVLGGVFDKLSGVFDDLHLSKEEKGRLEIEMEGALRKTLEIEISSREKVLVAELSQGDLYTKRARPSVVYFGLVLILIQALLLYLGREPLPIPAIFWMGWSAIVASYGVGRSFEKIAKIRANGNGRS